MRIIAGSAGGRRFAVPAGAATRPTSDRAREALFSTLTSLLNLEGAAVLDLYAGSGALGLEALSRGAAEATFVESDPAAARLIASSAADLGLAVARVMTVPVERFVGQKHPPPAYDVVFADPPYALPAAELAGQLTALGPALSAGAVVVVERSSRDPDWAWPEPLQALRVRRYGAGTLWYGRAS